MRRSSHLCFLLPALLALAAGVAHAQVVDPNLWVTDGVVTTSFLDGNKLYIGGDFDYVGPQTGSWASISRADLNTVTNAPRVNGTIYCAESDGAGGWFVGGAFTQVAGAARTNLAHFRADGTLDGWAPNPSATVRALLKLNNKLYVGGDFASTSGATRRGAAAYDLPTLALAPWSPAVLGGPVRALAYSAGRLYLGGEFTSVAGTARNRIAAIDTTSGALVAWDPNANGVVRTIVATPSRVYVGGSFTNIGGAARGRVAALSPATATALAFNPNADSDVNAMALRGAQLHLAGGFGTVAGVSRLGAASVDTATAVASAWSPVLYGSMNAIAFDEQYAYLGGLFSQYVNGGYSRQGFAVVDAAGSGVVRSLASPANGEVHTVQLGSRDVFVGGAFTSFGGERRTNVAALDLTSGRVTSWAPQANNPVRAILRGGAHVYVGGDFTNVGGRSRFFAAQLDTLEGAATNWDANPDSAVWCLAYGNNALYMGGTFRAVQLTTNLRNRLAAVNLTTGAPTAFNPNVGMTNNAPSQYSYVNSMQLVGSTLYFTGKFNLVGGVGRWNLGAVYTATGASHGWHPSIDDPKCVQRIGNRVYVGGNWFAIAGTVGANFMMTDTSGTASYTQDWFVDSTVTTFAMSGQRIYFGGGFSYMENQVRNGLGAADFANAPPIAWNPSPDVHDVRTLQLYGTQVLAGGGFAAMGTRATRGLARIWPAPASSPVVTVLKPNGGEHVRRGTTYRVTWTASAPTPGVQSVDVSYSTTGSGGPWTLVGAGVPNTGGYDFVVPTGAATGATCFVKVEARDWNGTLVGDASNSGFTLDNGVLDAPGELVTAFALEPIAPNPARGAAPVRFAMPRGGDVRVSVLDVMGREVRVLADGAFAAGRHSVTLESATLPPGLFFVRVQSGGASLTRRVAIVR